MYCMDKCYPTTEYLFRDRVTYKAGNNAFIYSYLEECPECGWVDNNRYSVTVVGAYVGPRSMRFRHVEV